MALAILKYVTYNNGQHVFEADIGTNRYYQYQIGRENRKHQGLALVDGTTHQSSVIQAKPGSNPFSSRFTFTVPAQLLDRERKYIQLFSFKSADKTAPAWSDIATVIPSLADRDEDFKLPKIMTLSHTNTPGTTGVHTQPAPCHIKENKVSEAMFFNTLLGAMPGLLTQALPALGQLLPALQRAAPAPALRKVVTTDTQPGSHGAEQVFPNISPDTIRAILEVIQQLSAKTDNASANGMAQSQSVRRYSHDFAINPAMLMQLAPLLEKVLSPETIKAIGDNPVKLFKAVSDSALKFQKMELDHLEKINPGVDDAAFDRIVQGMSRGLNGRSRYSQAKIAPALLAALPALMPVLEKVLSPDMINAIGEQPVKLFNAIADAGLKHTQQELNHLEKINPGVDDPAFDQIVASMSIKSSATIPAKFSNALTISFIEVKTIMAAGKERVVYDARQKMNIPITLQPAEKSNAAGTTIHKGIFQLIVQDSDSMDVLLEKKFKVKDVVIGTPVSAISLSTDDLKRLPLHKDLKLELSFYWKKDNVTRGTFKNHYISLTDGYLYQRIGQGGAQHFVLNDVSQHRNYWHKVWEGGPVTHKRWEINFQCKYYYQVQGEDAVIKKLETRKRTVHDSAQEAEADTYRRKISAQLKSGMEISLTACNALLAQQQRPPLTTAQLQALASPAFMKDAATVARVNVDFRGRQGETVALWTYPEGNIQPYILGKAVGTDPSGMVTALEEEEVYFPKFSSIHFIGTQSA